MSEPIARPAARSIQITAIAIFMAVALLAFTVDWFVRGRAPIREGCMALIILLILLAMRAVEPRMRRWSESTRARRQK